MATITRFTWTPDPIVFSNSMNAVATALENKVAPLLAASEATQADIRERFDTETDPQGDHWEPWSPNYAPVALGEVPAGDGGEAFPNIGILQRTEELAEVASSSRAIRISNDTVFYETNMLPHYGLEHEAGNPSRHLPQRSFLGLSEKATAVIFATFSEWFDGAIDLYVSATGRLSMRHAIQGSGGFVSRASVGRGRLPRF